MVPAGIEPASPGSHFRVPYPLDYGTYSHFDMQA